MLCSIVSLTAFADIEQPSSRFEVSGFGTFGVVQTSTDHAEFTRDQSQRNGAKRQLTAKQDSMLGVQAYFKASDSLEFLAQGVSRYNPDGDYRPELMAGFAKIAVSENLSFRAGRMGVEFYMLADSRHVGYSRLTVRPPGDFFSILPFQYVDGVDFIVTAPVGNGVLRGKAFVGQSGEEAPIYNEMLSLRGNPLAGGYLDYHAGNWQWRMSYAQMRFKHELPAPVSTLRFALQQVSLLGFPDAALAADRIAVTDTTSRHYSLGAVYDRGPVQIQAMLSEIRHESSLYQNARAGYVIAGYRVDEWMPFAGYSWTRSHDKALGSGLPGQVPLFAQINEALAGTLARTHTDQHTYSFGARWDFHRDMALKGQIDLIRGAADSIFLYPRNDAAFNGKLDVFSLALDFVF